MRKQTTFIFTLFALVALGFYSCKKSSSSSNPQSEILGTWKITGQAVDSNNSGTINYTLPTDTSWAHQTIKFTSDGKVLSTYYNEQSQSSWALTNNNTYIKLTDTGTHAGTAYYQVLTLNSTTL